MAIKVIVELRAKPGRRDELTRFVEKVVEELGPRMQEKGWLGSAFFEVPDDADVLVEIADWASAEGHEAALTDTAFGEAMAPGFDLLAGPFTSRLLQVPEGDRLSPSCRTRGGGESAVMAVAPPSRGSVARANGGHRPRQ